MLKRSIKRCQYIQVYRFITTQRRFFSSLLQPSIVINLQLFSELATKYLNLDIHCFIGCNRPSHWNGKSGAFCFHFLHIFCHHLGLLFEFIQTKNYQPSLYFFCFFFVVNKPTSSDVHFHDNSRQILAKMDFMKHLLSWVSNFLQFIHK